MKKGLLFLFIFIILSQNSYGFEIKGLQPVDPYGVFSTFSAESVPKGKVSFSTSAEVSIDPDFYRFIFKTAYGITNNIELNISVPYVFGADYVDGFEDFAIGYKHRFFEEGKYGPSLAYVLSASLPSGRDELSTDGRYGIGLIVSKRVGPINGHMNLFYNNPGDSDLKKEISFLTGLDFSAAHNFKILAELIVKKGHESKKIDLIEGRLGYRIKTTDFIYTTFGAGFDFKNRNPETRLMFTVTLLTPIEKKRIEHIIEEE